LYASGEKGILQDQRIAVTHIVFLMSLPHSCHTELRWYRVRLFIPVDTPIHRRWFLGHHAAEWPVAHLLFHTFRRWHGVRWFDHSTGSYSWQSWRWDAAVGCLLPLWLWLLVLMGRHAGHHILLAWFLGAYSVVLRSSVRHWHPAPDPEVFRISCWSVDQCWFPQTQVLRAHWEFF